MTDSYGEAIVEFLSDKDNLPLALDIADHVADVKLSINRQFWKEITRKFNEELKHESLGWTAFIDDKKTLNGKCPGVSIRHNELKGPFVFRVERWDHLYYGVYYPDDFEKPEEVSLQLPELQELKKLVDRLATHGVTKTDPKWLRWAYVFEFSAARKFFEEAVAVKDQLADSIFSESWKLFKSVRCPMEKANQEIRQTSKKPLD